MQEKEYELCIHIFSVIKNNPLSKLFWDGTDFVSNPKIIRPQSFNTIEQKLQKRTYKTYEQFLMDMYITIENVKVGYPEKSTKYWASKQFCQDMKKLFTEIRSHTFVVSYPLIAVTEAFSNNRSHPINDIEQTKRADQQPGSTFFDNDPSPEDRERLIRDIRLCDSPALTSRLAAYINSIQPEAISVGKIITFKIQNLSTQNLALVRKYVTKLIKNAASGSIEPFVRPFGQKSSPVEMSNTY